ncbi:MAG: hypothetical protein KJO13_00705, partial [Gammaproteobacteria bacterium]|nr:hypothetical protein [Gammaproteobacteria bacterium]
ESLRSVQVQGMRLGEPDEQGRRRPLPVPGALQELAADFVIVAVAQASDWHGLEAVDTAHRWLRTRDDGKLDKDLWAGGDDRGPSIASRAIAQGRLAAESAHAELRGERNAGAASARNPINAGAVKTDFYANQQRSQTPRRPQMEWLSNPDAEINQTINYEQASEEAARCMSCGLCFDCQQCFMYCNASGFTRIEETSPGSYFALALESCEGCGKCIDICPCGYLEARD